MIAHVAFDVTAVALFHYGLEERVAAVDRPPDRTRVIMDPDDPTGIVLSLADDSISGE